MVWGGRDCGAQHLPLPQGAASPSRSAASCPGQPHREGWQQPGGSLAPRAVRSLPGKAIPGDGQDVENTSRRKTQASRAAQLPRARSQPARCAGGAGMKNTLPKGREGAPRLSLVAQDQAASDCRQQLSPFLQKFPSAPLRDQNFPSTTREQLSPRSCASLPARIRRQPPPGILSKAQIFFPKRNSFIHHVCGPGNPESSDCTWHPSRHVVILSTKPDLLPSLGQECDPWKHHRSFMEKKKGTTREISVLAKPGRTFAVPQSGCDTARGTLLTCTKDEDVPHSPFPLEQLDKG